MKRLAISAGIVLCLSFCLFSCSKDSNDNQPTNQEITSFEKLIPNQFGKTYQELSQEFQVVKEGELDRGTHTCTIKINDPEYLKSYGKVVLHFDLLERKYRYATIEAKSFELLSSKEFDKMLRENQWTPINQNLPKDGELIYQKGKSSLRVFTKAGWSVKTPTIYLEENNQDVASWTRFEDLKDKKTGIWSPLAAIGCQKELFEAFEQLYGHSFNSEKSDLNKGLYAYNTEDSNYPLVTYQLDNDNKVWFEKSTIYINKEHPVDAAELERYVLGLGFADINVHTDDGINKYYYNQTTKLTCAIYINNPNLPKDKFSPRLEFMFKSDIENMMSPTTVNIPWPLTKFESITMEEAIQWYQANGFMVNVDNGIGHIYTTSPDCPVMVIFPSEKDPKLYGICNIPFVGEEAGEAEAKAYSPDVIKQLIDHGYVKQPNKKELTFYNMKENAQVILRTKFSANNNPPGLMFSAIGAFDD